MLVGLISDVHGNLVALETVLDRMEHEHNVDAIACAGDIVGVLGWPEEVATIIREEVDFCVYGNHDAYIRDDYAYVPTHDSQKQEHRVVTTELTQQSVEWLNALPPSVQIDDNVVMAHAHPYVENKAGYPAEEYVDKREWTKFGSEHMDGQTVVMGHTHDQGHLDLDKFQGMSGKIINPGAVGAPYYKDARYALLDTETMESWLYRAHYPDDELEARFDQLGLERDSKVKPGAMYTP